MKKVVKIKESEIKRTGNTSKPGALEKNEIIIKSIGLGSFLNKNLRIKKQIIRPTSEVTVVETIDEKSSVVVESC